jgi:InsA-like protein
MVSVPVQCPHCHSTEVIKAGKQASGAQRYQCQNGPCARRIWPCQLVCAETIIGARESCPLLLFSQAAKAGVVISCQIWI